MEGSNGTQVNVQLLLRHLQIDGIISRQFQHANIVTRLDTTTVLDAFSYVRQPYPTRIPVMLATELGLRSRLGDLYDESRLRGLLRRFTIERGKTFIAGVVLDSFSKGTNSKECFGAILLLDALRDWWADSGTGACALGTEPPDGACVYNTSDQARLSNANLLRAMEFVCGKRSAMASTAPRGG